MKSLEVEEEDVRGQFILNLHAHDIKVGKVWILWALIGVNFPPCKYFTSKRWNTSPENTHISFFLTLRAFFSLIVVSINCVFSMEVASSI